MLPPGQWPRGNFRDGLVIVLTVSPGSCLPPQAGPTYSSQGSHPQVLLVAACIPNL